MPKALIFAQTNNRKGKRDGDEFWRCACEFSEWFEAQSPANSCDVVGIDVKGAGKAGTRRMILDILDTNSGLDFVGFFCHGHPWGLSLGINSKWGTPHTKVLAKAIAGACEGRVKIGLFACSCGRGRYMVRRERNVKNRWLSHPTNKEGFAMHLCGELQQVGCRADIMAHLHPGHTVRNWSKVMCYPLAGIVRRERMEYSKDAPDWAFRLIWND
jgi:hypothetical protein